MEELPNEVLVAHILTYLTNDGVSVGRFSLCSTGLYNRITLHSPQIWKALVETRWRKRCSHGNMMSSDYLYEQDVFLRDNQYYRWEYLRRHEMDRTILNYLQDMTTDLRHNLELNQEDRVDGSPHIGQAWDHPAWKVLLSFRSEALDVLKPLARQCLQQPDNDDDDDDDDANASSFDGRLLGFLAARCLQNVHFAECLHQWKEISEFQERSTEDPKVINAIVLERYALLVGEIQQSPPDLLLPRDDGRSNDDESVTQVVVRRLDEMAETCRRRIVREQETSDGNTTMTTTKRLKIVNEVLIQEYQLSGNQEDYYDYRNSLLHHVLLKSKKGIPITLCIIYVCVCRRLDIHVHLTGLPGHVVLGYAFQETTTDKGWGFLDVFRGGQLLTLHDCQRICASYAVPWNVDYLTPLPATAVLQRILNNLTNCHFQAMSADLPFHSDLFFQQRALDAILRQPPGIAGPLVDRVTQELPLTLSPDLLRYYGLLSPQPQRSSSTTTGD